MKYINMFSRNVTALIMLIAWIMGVVLAKGFWLVTFSIFFPFYAWYLVVEKIMLMTGFN